MIAMFDGRCKRCSQRITKGDTIASRRGGWMHHSCMVNNDNEAFEARTSRVDMDDGSGLYTRVCEEPFVGKGKQLNLFGGE